MSPSLALFICFALIVALFRYDPAKDPNVSGAIWIPLIWMMILASRLPSQWLGVTALSATDAYQDGNSLDRVVYIGLIILAIRTLVSRSFRLADLFTENAWLSMLVALGLLSVVWSDFPFISFKRWFRDLGGYLMIAVVLSEARPLQAFAELLRRISYLVIPLSVVLIKYYPTIGRGYSGWTGEPYYLGVTVNKNLLGVLCLLSGLLFFWDVLGRWKERKDRRVRQVLLVDAVLLGMTIWLLVKASSSTSTLCLAIGCAILTLGKTSFIQKRPSSLKFIVPASVALYFALDFVFDVGEIVTGLVGRNTTFTGRTDLWAYLDSMDKNWLLGAGYEAFWLGPRLQQIWAEFPYGPNQAHNGYREMYLNLGMIGVLALCVFLLSSYRRISSRLSSSTNEALFSFTLWTVLILYNITEAAFKNGHVLWFVFVMASFSLAFSAKLTSTVQVAAPRYERRLASRSVHAIASPGRLSRR